VDRIGQYALLVPRAVMPLVVIGVAAAVLALLGPAVFLRNREPFDRLMEFLELVLGRPRPARRRLPASLDQPVPGARRRGSTGPK
jgi:hypothetical protein